MTPRSARVLNLSGLLGIVAALASYHAWVLAGLAQRQRSADHGLVAVVVGGLDEQPAALLGSQPEAAKLLTTVEADIVSTCVGVAVRDASTAAPVPPPGSAARCTSERGAGAGPPAPGVRRAWSFPYQRAQRL